MKVKYVKLFFKDADGDGTSSVVKSEPQVSDLHYLVKDGLVCINYVEDGERKGWEYPTQDVEAVETRASIK